MLVTYSCWQFQNVGDRIKILVTSYECWCPTLMLRDRGCWWPERPKLSPTSSNCPQHIFSPTSVTNINVALDICHQHRIKRLMEHSTRQLSFWMVLIKNERDSLSQIGLSHETRISITLSWIIQNETHQDAMTKLTYLRL